MYFCAVIVSPINVSCGTDSTAAQKLTACVRQTSAVALATKMPKALNNVLLLEEQEYPEQL